MGRDTRSDVTGTPIRYVLEVIARTELAQDLLISAIATGEFRSSDGALRDPAQRPSSSFGAASREALPSAAAIVAAGTESGDILFFDANYELVGTLEIKGGAIQCIARLRQQTATNDSDRGQQLVASDSGGIVTFYSGKQVLSRRKLTDSVVCSIEPVIDRTGQEFCILGELDGVLSAVRMHDQMWRVQLRRSGATAAMINTVASVRLPDAYGLETEYALAATEGRFVYLLCSGFFLEKTDATDRRDRRTQVAMAGDAGEIFLLDNYQVQYLGRVPYAVTHMFLLDADKSKQGSVDSLLCVTKSRNVYIVNRGGIVEVFRLEGWPVAADVHASKGDSGSLELVLALQSDNGQQSIHAVRVTARD
ncbi:hypothetical protein EV182_004060 [Spiromyces aspiralis]|uniref:Uncharacterized protein n=1 Tax=Spiromyces aspiralis TaxID=68401 RepID=A0ACC1HBY0_9FUNG|nr:hypothetical protein EV182_004060 [Spiromyces aspiralis]